jgi:hypothetical protein
MHKRIEELAAQQGLKGANYLISSRELEQFARVIVCECALISETSPDVSSAVQIMKQHFGIEE